MNTKKLSEYLSHKTWLWQRVFCNFYAGQHNLYDVLSEKELKVSTLIRLCQNVDDVEEMWDLAQQIDSYEEPILGYIKRVNFCMPIPWQYDFLQEIAEISVFPVKRTLCMENIADAYCSALQMKDFDVVEFTAGLDKTYKQLYTSAAQKEKLFNRNLSLELDASFYHRFGENTAEMNSRELVDRYLGQCGLKGLKTAMELARTPELKLTPEERACFGYSYYSPFYFDEEALQQSIPGLTVFSCVEDQLAYEQKHRQSLQEALRHADNEDDEDEIGDMLEMKHHFIYVDPMDSCLMDIRLGDVVYANVYIQKISDNYLNNMLPDFIRLHKGLLYTVEFVDNLSELEVAKGFLQRLNAIKCALQQLEKACISNPLWGWQPMVRQQYAKLREEYSRCYYLGYKE